MMENADLAIVIVDSSQKLEKSDEEILKLIKNKKAIIVLNKIDKKQEIGEKDILNICPNKDVVSISALNKIGIEKIYEKIAKMYSFSEINIDDSITITNERHKQAIINMQENIRKAKDSIRDKRPIDIITINITNILEEIGKITGEGVSEDIINEIFKKFCLGK